MTPIRAGSSGSYSGCPSTIDGGGPAGTSAAAAGVLASCGALCAMARPIPASTTAGAISATAGARREGMSPRTPRRMIGRSRCS